MADQNLKINITGDSSKLSNALSSASSKLSAFGSKMQSVGKSMTMKLTLPLVAAGAAATKMAFDFDKSMTSIQALVGVSSEKVAEMGEAAKKMAVDTGKSSKEAAEALFFITSAGLRGSEAMDVLKMSLKAAAVGLGETKTIADLSTSAMNAYGSGTLSASGATDILTAAVREGKLEASALAGAMGGVIPLASNMGVSFDQVGAALAAMSKTGTDAATGATQLTAILASLKKPSAEAEQAFSAMGMTTESVQKSISEKGLLSTLEMLQNGLKQTGKDTTAIFPNIRALKGVLDLTGAGLEDNRRIFDALSKSMGATDTAFKKTAKSASYEMTQGLNSMKESLMGVGEVILKAIAPSIKELGEFITDLSNKFKELSPQTQKIIIAFAGIVAALGPLLVVLGALMTTVIPGLTTAFTALTAAMVANPFGLIAVAIASVIGYFVFFNDETEKAIKNQDLFSKINDKAAKSIINEKAKLSELLAIAKHEGVSKKHRIDAIRELNKLSPKYLGDLTLEKINTDSARVAVELYNKELLKTARIKVAQEKLQEITAKIITIELAETKKLVGQAEKLKTLKENAITQADFLKIKSQEQIGYGRTQTVLYTSQLDLLKQQEKAILDLITAEATRTTTTSLGGGGGGGGVSTRPMATSALDGISTAEIQTPISDSIDADTARMPQAFADQQAVFAQNTLTALDQAAQFSQRISQIMTGGLQNLASGIGAALGNAISTGGSLVNALGGLLLGTIGSIAIQLGKAAIQIGIAMKAIKLSFKNPLTAIAAGIALVAVGTMIKNTSSIVSGGGRGAGGSSFQGGGFTSGGISGGGGGTAFANGGIVSGPTMGLVGEYPGARQNPEVIAPLNKLQSIIGKSNNGGNLNVTGQVRIDGQDLLIAIERANETAGRIY